MNMNSHPFRFIDAHHHLWDLEACDYPWLMAKGEQRFFGDPSSIQKNYLVSDFLNESTQYCPEKSVHIQVGTSKHDSLKETQWLQQQSPVPNAIVAFCDLSAENYQQQIDAQKAYSKVKGVRQIIGRHADEDSKHGSHTLLVSANWRKAMVYLTEQGLSFDLQMIPPQIDAVYKALQTIPNVKIALCHGGSPWDQSPSGLDSWQAGLKKLSTLPNVCCKVSGLGMFNNHWRDQDLASLIERIVDTFGPGKTMFGSNFPVDKLYRSYDNYWDCYRSAVKQYSCLEQHQMFYQTASNFYQMD
jgi:predicted TIM-barrel fold metal-dependent hydrolase